MNKNNQNTCELVDDCPFFREKMARMPRSTEIMKDLFCLKEYEKCARHIVFSECGKESVPMDLFPNEFERARVIVMKYKE